MSQSPQFTLTDWHRFHRIKRSCSNLSEQSNLWLGRRPSSENFGVLESPASSTPATGSTPAAKVEFVREDFVCKNARNVHEEYEFEVLLGKGSFGEVHRARHIRTGVHRAIKELPKVDTLAEEFEWELRALIALDHPHIVQVVEHFEEFDKWFIVMELCTGPDLFTYILGRLASEDTAAPQCIPERDVSIILRHCLKAVLCCHAHGFVHRDLNAKNFMLTGSDMTVKLIDFGLATRFLPNEKYEEVVGTSHYMAPEMMLNGLWTTAVDIWSLGVLFFVLLTGTMLLPKDDEKKKKMLKKVNFSKLRLRGCQQLQARELSAQARDLLEQMLMHDPAERVTASRALSHPFIVGFCTETLGPPLEFDVDFDMDVVLKMRRFSKAPRLKKVVLLIMAHLASAEDHEQDLLRAQHTFRAIDKDGDGEISLEELQRGLASHSIKAPSDLQAIFALCNGSGTGRLSLVEFVACVLPSNFMDERSCSEVYNVLDRDYNGCISAEDLRLAHPAYNLETCKEMIGEADPSGKGFIDFDDFQRFACSAVEGNQPTKPAEEASEGTNEVAEPPHSRRRLG